MGHFSYSCALTGLPITGGNKCVLLPLKKKKLYSEHSDKGLEKSGVGCFVSNDGERIFYTEGTYPIFGKYDSYGGIEEIEKDDNTALIEEYFGISIEEFCELVCSTRRENYNTDTHSEFHDKKEKVKNFDELLSLSATWFRREIYDDLKIAQDSEWRRELDLGHDEILTALGFKFEKKLEDKNERFNQVYKKDKIKVKSDGSWLHNPINGNGIYRLSDLKDYCKEKGIEIDINSVRLNSYEEQVYELILPTVQKRVPVDMAGMTRETATTEKIIELIEDLRLSLSPSPNSRLCDSLFCPVGYMETPKLFFKYCQDFVLENHGKLKSNIIDWLNFRPNLHNLGKFLSPISTSPQDGDHEGVRRICEIALKIINHDISLREES